MAYTMEMGPGGGRSSYRWNDQVSAPGIPGTKPKATRPPDLARIGSVPGQACVACWRYVTLEATIG